MVYFSLSADGQEITVDYQGVGTLFLAEHANAFRAFMLRGAREQAVEEIARYDDRVSMAVRLAADSIIGAIDEHCGRITAAMQEIAEAIRDKGGAFQLASDEEADSLLDEYFPGDVDDVGEPSIFASDREAQELIDEYLPMPPAEGTLQEDAAGGQ